MLGELIITSVVFKQSLLTGLPGVSVVKNRPANARDPGDVGLIPGSGSSTGGGNGNPLHYSCLENPHGWRSLAGYGLGVTESPPDTTERLSMHTNKAHTCSMDLLAITLDTE